LLLYRSFQENKGYHDAFLIYLHKINFRYLDAKKINPSESIRKIEKTSFFSKVLCMCFNDHFLYCRHKKEHWLPRNFIYAKFLKRSNLQNKSTPTTKENIRKNNISGKFILLRYRVVHRNYY